MFDRINMTSMALLCCLLLLICAVGNSVRAEVLIVPNQQQSSRWVPNCRDSLEIKRQEVFKLTREKLLKDKIIEDLKTQIENYKRINAQKNFDTIAQKFKPARRCMQSQNLIQYVPTMCRNAGKNLKMVSLELRGGNNYYISTNLKLTWYNANKFCKKHGLELISIENEKENTAVKNELAKKGTLQVYPYEGYWTSGTDLGKEGQWYWESTGADFGYNDWGAWEPNNKNGNQNCACIWSFKNIIHWDDYECDFTNRFICEMPAACKKYRST